MEITQKQPVATTYSITTNLSVQSVHIFTLKTSLKDTQKKDVFIYYLIGPFSFLLFFFPFHKAVSNYSVEKCYMNKVCLLEGTNIRISILHYASNHKKVGEAVFHFGSKHSSLVDISVIAPCLPTIPCSNCAGSGLSHRYIRVETGRRVAQTHSKAPNYSSTPAPPP